MACGDCAAEGCVQDVDGDSIAYISSQIFRRIGSGGSDLFRMLPPNTKLLPRCVS